jgi:hypothetical protein
VALPLYTTVKEWEPAASVDVAREAVPPLKDAEPNATPPSWNVTPPVADAGETVAVRVTVLPTTEGFAELPSPVVVARRPVTVNV